MHAGNQTESFGHEGLDDEDICYYLVRPAEEYERTAGTLYLEFDSIKDTDVYLFPTGDFDSSDYSDSDSELDIRADLTQSVDAGARADVGVKYRIEYTMDTKLGFKIVALPETDETGSYEFHFEFI